MKRRTVLKHMAVVGGMAFLLPSCVRKISSASIALDRININGEDEQLMSDLCDTLIPATTQPGGKLIGAHLFSLRMVNDCFSPSEQARFVKGLSDFTKGCKEKTGNTFSDLSKEDRQSFLMEKERKSESDDAVFFYSSVKRLCIQAYTQSEYYLTQVNVYELVPGRYHGCVSLKVA